MTPKTIGYVQHLDTGELQATAEASDVLAHVAALPRAFVDPSRPLAQIAGEADEATLARIAGAFTICAIRPLEQDPCFGLQVLAEIASRALSPTVNDPGTAIDVLSRAVRPIALWAERREVKLMHPQVWVPEISAGDLFEDVFRPIARDGAALVEVQMRLHKALAALALFDPDDFARAAARQSDEALAQAEAALAVEDDGEVLHELNAAVHAASNAAGPGI